MQPSFLGKIIALLMPHTCPICKRRLVGSEEFLCLSCYLSLPFTHTWQDLYSNEMAKLFWGRIPVERCASLFYYHSHSRPSLLIYQLKYGNRPDIGVNLGRLLATTALSHQFFDGIDAIIPIPLSPSRKKARGYNQSEKIAIGIQQITGIPIITDAIARTSFKESQTHKDRWQRMENVEDVFRLCDTYHDPKGKHPIDQLAGKHLLIIDDVCTTGATITSCCQKLLKAGKMKFSIMSCAWAKN